MNGHIAKPINVSNFYQTLSTYLALADGKEMASNKPAMPTNENADYPVLEGIDVEQAIFNTGGSAKSYFSIFERFLESQKVDGQSMLQLARSKEWETLGRMAHTLKGASANLGIDSVARLARKIEIQIEEQSDGVVETCQKIRDLVSQLNDQFTHWQKHRQQESKPIYHELKELYEQLVENVNNYDVNALDVIKQVKQSELWDSEQVETLINLIENFEFEQAKELLAQLPRPH
jgi:HPt (histidine-containing phosphotransfer) domain-containing protein